MGISELSDGWLQRGIWDLTAGWPAGLQHVDVGMRWAMCGREGGTLCRPWTPYLLGPECCVDAIAAGEETGHMEAKLAQWSGGAQLTREVIGRGWKLGWGPATAHKGAITGYCPPTHPTSSPVR